MMFGYSLNKARDFKLLFSKGKKIDRRFFRLIFRPNNTPHPRFACITPRLVSKSAVQRNLLKRRAREWIRAHAPGNVASLDIALVFKKDAILAPRKVFYEELEKAFKKL